MKIIIFADGDNKIGLGHVVRTLNLANMLKKKHKIILVQHNLSKKMEF